MLRRFSSRRAGLYDEFLKPRLAGATRYDRIAGYFQSSLLELANESLADIPRIRTRRRLSAVSLLPKAAKNANGNSAALKG